MTGRWRVFVVLVGCVAVLWAATGLDARLPRAAAAGPAPDASSTPAPSLAAAPVLYFVHLGDIWRFDAQAGAVSVFQGAGGACVGHVSWSADGRTVAWETRVWTEGQARSSVMVRRLPLTPSGPELLRTFADAASPAVSPDGLHLLYQAADAGRSSLMCVDLESDAAVTVMQGARNGAWVSVAEAPGEARLQVAFQIVGVQLDQPRHHQIAAAVDGARPQLRAPGNVGDDAVAQPDLSAQGLGRQHQRGIGKNGLGHRPPSCIRVCGRGARP